MKGGSDDGDASRLLSRHASPTEPIANRCEAQVTVEGPTRRFLKMLKQTQKKKVFRAIDRCWSHLDSHTRPDKPSFQRWAACEIQATRQESVHSLSRLASIEGRSCSFSRPRSERVVGGPSCMQAVTHSAQPSIKSVSGRDDLRDQLMPSTSRQTDF